MRSLLLCSATLLVLTAASTASADRVMLTNGSEIRGRIIKETAASVKIESSGITMTIPKARVEWVKANSPDEIGKRPSVGGFVPQDPMAHVGPGGVSARLYDIYLRRLSNDMDKPAASLTQQERTATLRRAIDEELLLGNRPARSETVEPR